MFKMLDEDLDGFISANNVDIEKIDPNKLKLIMPVLVEMEEKQIVLDKDSFSLGVKKLAKSLTIVDREYLLDLDTRKKP